MHVTSKKLEKWCKDHGFVTSRGGIDFDAAGDALGIGRRSLIRYLREGTQDIPPYVGLAMIGYDTLHARDAA